MTVTAIYRAEYSKSLPAPLKGTGYGYSLGKIIVKSQQAIEAASGLAADNGNLEILPLHLMTVLLEDHEGVVLPVLEKIGVPAQQLLATLNSGVEKLPKVSGGAAQPNMSSALNKVLEQAFKEASNFKDEYVSTEHLLLALATQKNDPVQLALAAQGATHDAILKALTVVRGAQRVTDQNPEGKFQALEKYGKDLTDLARKGKLDPVIGRDDEIRRTCDTSVVKRRHARTIPCSSANPALARRPSSKVSRAASSPAMCLRYCATSA